MNEWTSEWVKRVTLDLNWLFSSSRIAGAEKKKGPTTSNSFFPISTIVSFLPIMPSLGKWEEGCMQNVEEQSISRSPGSDMPIANNQAVST